MVDIKKQIITNEAMEPVGVIISYEDWQKIEALLKSDQVDRQANCFDSGSSDRGKIMAAALNELADINAFADIDPVEWQRESRQERSLPGRE